MEPNKTTPAFYYRVGPEDRYWLVAGSLSALMSGVPAVEVCRICGSAVPEPAQAVHTAWCDGVTASVGTS